MHYFLKESLEGLAAAHVEFLKRELSGLDWARDDVEKMKEVQARKLCEAKPPVTNKRASGITGTTAAGKTGVRRKGRKNS